VRLIPNSYLTLSDIPSPDADINAIELFALTFDGDEHWGSVEECARVVNSQGQSTLTDLRTWLYFERRRWHQIGQAPDEKAEGYWRSLVEKMRARVQADDLV
jgi:hypothetical protein